MAREILRFVRDALIVDSFKYMMEIIRKIYRKLKTIPLLGLVIVFLRNIANWKIFLEPRLKRKDYLKAKEILFKLFGHEAINELNNFRKSQIFKKHF